MDYPVTPRIIAPHLQAFQDRTVRMTGKLVELRGDTAIIDAGGNVNVIMNRDAPSLATGTALEIIGKVDGNLSLKALATTDMGMNMDFNAVQTLVEVNHRHKEIFYH